QISEENTVEAGFIPLVTLSPEWEQSFGESVTAQGEERQLTMAPSRLQEFIAAVRQTFERHAMLGDSPVLLSSPGIRPFVRSIVERVQPSIVVMSQNEIYPKARIKTLDHI
ncbi:MAG: EscV/YscV/HrcV family type III secretion system export apparatus protein, partial [Rhodospirillaceae bacterium]|nr:EscV/YscV/HrcV family type III secretion system export apparatus protein [Rhodospirillaceae bacterium]